VKRKVKIIKKENEEKDSLFKEKIKSQAAMEYLMTYGWAILIIALTLAVLYSLGIMNPKNFLPRAPPGSCFVFRPNGPGTTDFVSLQGTCGYLPMYVGSFNGVNGWIGITSSSFNKKPTWTLSSWVFPYNTGGSTGFIYSEGNPAATFELWIDSSGAIVVGIWNAQYSGNWLFATSSSGAVKFNSWNFITITLENGGVGTGTLKFYSNGNYISSSTGQMENNDYTSYSAIGDNVGAHYGGTQRAYLFYGLIANLQTYSTALTQQEIQYLYQQGLGGGPIRLGSLVGWWPLNGDAKDYSGNNNHGTINGGVTFVQNYNPP
jgi:hypothetical protein